MARHIRWSPKAADQFEGICDYIAQDSPTYARIFAKRVNAVIEDLPLFPQSGRIVPEYGDEDLREKILGNYRIVYRIKLEVIEVAAICHGSRLLPDLI